MSDVTEADVRARVDRLLAEHGGDDETAFLGAQFDAGLARMDYPVGLGGLDASPKLQEIVDEALERAGRRYPWIRNAMGIGMCVSNARAVIEGFFTRGGEFVRTPKYALQQNRDSFVSKSGSSTFSNAVSTGKRL